MLRSCGLAASLQRLRDHRKIALNVGMVGGVRHAHQRAEPQRRRPGRSCGRAACQRD